MPGLRHIRLALARLLQQVVNVRTGRVEFGGHLKGTHGVGGQAQPFVQDSGRLHAGQRALSLVIKLADNVIGSLFDLADEPLDSLTARQKLLQARQRIQQPL
jgi:hypothetical protein